MCVLFISFDGKAHHPAGTLAVAVYPSGFCSKAGMDNRMCKLLFTVNVPLCLFWFVVLHGSRWSTDLFLGRVEVKEISVL